MSKFFAGRPGANQAAFNQEIRGMGQQVDSPYEIAPRVQGVAEGQIKQAERMRTDATRGFYNTDANEQLSAGTIQGLLDEIDATISRIGPNTESAAPLRQLKSKLVQQQETQAMQPSNVLDMYGVPMRAGEDAAKAAVPETQVSRLLTAYKETRDKLDALPLDPNSIQKTAKGTVGPINQLLGEALETNPNIKAGNQLYGKISKEVVDPFRRSPVGQLAETDDLTKQLNTLFGSNPPVGSESGVSDAISRISQQDPEAARSLVAQHLEKTFNEATQKLTSGENQWGAAKFSSVVRGNTQQQKNLEAAIKSLPGGDDINAGFNRMLEVFDAQGKRLQAGSPTAQNTKYMNVMGAKVNLSAPLHTVQEMVDQFRYGRNLKQIADTLTNPNSVDKLKELAKLPANSPKAARIVEQMMGPSRAYGQTEGQPQEEYQAPMPSPQQAAPQTVAPQASAKPKDIKSQIADISQQFGNDPQLMQRMAGVESGFKSEAKAKTSSAEGLYQFTQQTWGDMVKKYGKQYGLKPDGRKDPIQSTMAANLMLKDNAQALEKTLGRTPTGVELYMAHFLGAGGASKMLTNLGQQIAAADVNPEAANANKSIFSKMADHLHHRGSITYSLKK
jgi:Transglycosylase SLT domain.